MAKSASSTVQSRVTRIWTYRFLEGDDVLEGDNPITIENLTLTNGACTTGIDCEYGGGAVLTGGGAGDEFVATNLVVTNNSTTDSGDVALYDGAGSTTAPTTVIGQEGATIVAGWLVTF